MKYVTPPNKVKSDSPSMKLRTQRYRTLTRAAHGVRIQQMFIKQKLPNGKEYTAEIPIFASFIAPSGYLTNDVECHALFMYNLVARTNWESFIQNPIELEGDKPRVPPNFRRLYESIASWYRVHPPETMSFFWDQVTKQCFASDCPMIPNEERYRFNKPMVLSS